MKRPSFRKLVEKTELLLSENTKNVSKKNEKLTIHVSLCFYSPVRRAGYKYEEVFLNVGTLSHPRCFSGLPETEQPYGSTRTAEGAIA